MSLHLGHGTVVLNLCYQSCRIMMNREQNASWHTRAHLNTHSRGYVVFRSEFLTSVTYHRRYIRLVHSGLFTLHTGFM